MILLEVKNIEIFMFSMNSTRREPLGETTGANTCFYFWVECGTDCPCETPI